jgi:uncharacterized protein (TIGR03437 family)
VAPVEVRIGGVASQVVYAGAAPGLVAGVMQLHAVVPDGVDGGEVAVTVVIGGVESQGNVTVAVKQ